MLVTHDRNTNAASTGATTRSELVFLKVFNKKPPSLALWGFPYYRFTFCLKCFEHRVQAVFGIAEQHACVVLEEQRILHSGVTGCHTALENDRNLTIPALQYRHATDRAIRVCQGRRIDDVVGADDDGDVNIGEIIVDFIHFETIS